MKKQVTVFDRRDLFRYSDNFMEKGNDRKVGCVTCVSCPFTFILMWQKKVEMDLMFGDPILFSLSPR